MKKLIPIIAVLGLAWGGYNWRNRIDHAAPSASVEAHSADDRTLVSAISSHQSNVTVHGYGVVTRLLPDDTSGIRHQRFIIQLDSGLTLLIAHNINRARRVDVLKVGDRMNSKANTSGIHKEGLFTGRIAILRGVIHLDGSSAVALPFNKFASNQAMGRTADRRKSAFEMTFPISPRARRAFVRHRSSWSHWIIKHN